MNFFKKISINKFELKGKATLISADKAKSIAGGDGGRAVGETDECR